MRTWRGPGPAFFITEDRAALSRANSCLHIPENWGLWPGDFPWAESGRCRSSVTHTCMSTVTPELSSQSSLPECCSVAPGGTGRCQLALRWRDGLVFSTQNPCVTKNLPIVEQPHGREHSCTSPSGEASLTSLPMSPRPRRGVVASQSPKEECSPLSSLPTRDGARQEARGGGGEEQEANAQNPHPWHPQAVNPEPNTSLCPIQCPIKPSLLPNA